MTRAELLEANTALRDAIDEILDLIDLDFDPQKLMDMDELEEENEQLEEILSKVRDAGRRSDSRMMKRTTSAWFGKPCMEQAVLVAPLIPLNFENVRCLSNVARHGEAEITSLERRSPFGD